VYLRRKKKRKKKEKRKKNEGKAYSRVAFLNVLDSNSSGIIRNTAGFASPKKYKKPPLAAGRICK